MDWTVDLLTGQFLSLSVNPCIPLESTSWLFLLIDVLSVYTGTPNGNAKV